MSKPTGRPNGRPPKPLAERFWQYVDRRSPDECWLWTAGISTDGYGKFAPYRKGKASGGSVRAHRMAWELANGPIPVGLLILHSCDCRLCVNPAHLRVGTPAENSTDMVTRGRWNGKQKLTPDQVREVRARYANGERQVDIAARFGLQQASISQIVRRQNWRNVA